MKHVVAVRCVPRVLLLRIYSLSLCNVDLYSFMVRVAAVTDMTSSETSLSHHHTHEGSYTSSH